MQQENNVFSLFVFSIIILFHKVSFVSVQNMITVTKKRQIMFLKDILWGELIESTT